MATLTQANSNVIRRLQERLLNSRFFTISLVLHIVLVLVVGTREIIKRSDPPDFTGEPGGFVPPGAVERPPEPTILPTQEFKVDVATAPSAPTIPTITTASLTPTFILPTIVNPTISPDAKALNPTATVTPPSMSGMTPAIAQGIAAFTVGNSKSGRGGSAKNREFEFTAYLAKYGDPHDKKRGGDWASTVHLKKGEIVSGSLPNLLYIMQKLSRNKIKGIPQAVPLDLSTDEIFAKKPPFILFTGHRDFTLTDKEVANLQKYIRVGGCIWGDSSLPGLRSRFDIAFKREMKRVVPDIDKQFEPLPLNHEIFTKAYYTEIKEVPPGMNYYKEAIQVLKVYDEIVILYTANDYGDMWQFGLNEKGEIDTRKSEGGEYVALNTEMYSLREVYFRNVSAPALLATYKFGTNIIFHLLTRWEDKVSTVPSSL